jgi:hypothetical protein
MERPIPERESGTQFQRLEGKHDDQSGHPQRLVGRHELVRRHGVLTLSASTLDDADVEPAAVLTDESTVLGQ